MAKLREIVRLFQWIIFVFKTFSYCQLFSHLHKSPPPHEIPPPPVITNHIRAITPLRLFRGSDCVRFCVISSYLILHRLARTRIKGVSDLSDSAFYTPPIPPILHPSERVALTHQNESTPFYPKTCRKSRKWFPGVNILFCQNPTENTEILPPP